MNSPDISIIYRALNEDKFFEKSIIACKNQLLDDLTYEILLVDSGSTDRTLEIADKYNCRIIHIPRHKFSFGRSLNWGCEAALGKHLVFISAHCIPAHDKWLINLLTPILENKVHYAYGSQIGSDESKFSEKQLFAKYFPSTNQIPQDGFFVNNANSAITHHDWMKYRFDEHVTGLEDMVLGKRLIEEGRKIGYVADAPVIHIHEETMDQTKRRYYREALTLRTVMPDVHMNFKDFLRYLWIGILNDFKEAKKQKVLNSKALEIFLFRTMQFWGAYKGHNENRKLSREQKEAYYYPKIIKDTNLKKNLKLTKTKTSTK